MAHGDDRDLVGALPEIADGRAGDDEAAEQDLPGPRRRDDPLRPRARALHDAPSGEVEPLDRRGRVARVEAEDGPAPDLAREEERAIGTLEGERLLVVGDEDDLRRAGGDAERGRREGAEDVDDHGVAGRAARALEQRGGANDHRTVAVNGRRAV